MLNRTIDWGQMKCAGIDSFMAQAVNGLDASSLKDRGNRRRLGIYINSPLKFHNNDGTLQQLKNAGGLRLIEKQIVSDSIIYYDNRMKYADEQK